MAGALLVANPPGQQVVRDNISWEEYEHLLASDLERRVPRFTYDRGALEIMSPLPEHEEDAEALKLLVELVAAASSRRVKRMGSTTFRRADLERGFEPDGSFYIRNEPRVRGRRRIDLALDPPPDLVIEIEVTRSALDKLPIFAGLGVPEVWRYDGTRVMIFLLTADSYQEATTSFALPPLTSEVLTQFLDQSRIISSIDWMHAVSDWARAHRAADTQL